MKHLLIFILTFSLLVFNSCSELPLDEEVLKGKEKALKEQAKFLGENKKNSKIKETESGLQYEILEEGFGPKPGPTSRVKVHYHGTTPNGDVFDSSIERGQPAEFGLNQVIKGWTEGLQLMNVGSKYKFYIPEDLAYGATPQPGSIIEPYMPLVFEVELLEVLTDAQQEKEDVPLTSLKFDKMKHDFGKVKEDTDNKTFFTVTNTGQNPLVIESVKASCGCTTPSKPEKPIEPGKSDKIEVVFHPKVGQLEQQNKTIRVVANTVPSETILNVGAFVEKK